jgi:polyisoprenyl-phosphate glycosyltransferase
MPPKVSIIIPAYNEEKAIGEDVDAVRRTMEKTDYPFEILVVNDGSRDRTEEIALEHGARVINHHENKGVGAARKTGIRAAEGEIIVMLDGDGTYPAYQIPDLLGYMDRCDLCVGDRSREAGTWKILRKPAKWIIRRIASYVTGKKIYDLNSGLRAFYKNTAMRFFNILPEGHSWVSTLTIAYLANGLTVKYTPIDYHPRKGSSTFNPISDTLQYLGLVFRTVMYFKPLKVFVPLAGLFFGAGVIKLFMEGPLASGPIKESTIILITFGGLVGVMGLLADLIVKLNRPAL